MKKGDLIVMTPQASSCIPEHVSRCLQLAILLEVSAYPKPGNIHRTADFQGTRYEHFLASAVATAPHFNYAAKLGVEVSDGKRRAGEVGVGKIIRDTVADLNAWQRGGNTLLGSIILLAPISVAAGTTLADTEFSVSTLRKNLKQVVELTTPADAVNVYEAIDMAKPGGLGKAPKLDVKDKSSKKRIIDENMSLFEIFKISAPWDSVSSEWVRNHPIIFDIGHPYLAKQLSETKDVNTATVHTFLKILSKVPDTLIARKRGLAEARTISMKAKEILEIGGLTTSKGRKTLRELDKKLRDPKHQLNPGTTADLTGAALALAILNGYRP